MRRIDTIYRGCAKKIYKCTEIQYTRAHIDHIVSITVYAAHITHTLHVTSVCPAREPPQLSCSVRRKCFPIGRRNNRARCSKDTLTLYNRPLLISRYRTRERFQSAPANIPEWPRATEGQKRSCSCICERRLCLWSEWKRATAIPASRINSRTDRIRRRREGARRDRTVKELFVARVFS